MSIALCSECSAEIELGDDIVVGEVTPCPDCGVDLEVIETRPPTLQRAPEVEEDWGE